MTDDRIRKKTTVLVTLGFVLVLAVPAAAEPFDAGTEPAPAWRSVAESVETAFSWIPETVDAAWDFLSCATATDEGAAPHGTDSPWDDPELGGGMDPDG